jgi:hypothetical protein
VRAYQLTEALTFTDSLGRDHSGQPGDYLVETSDGIRRITSRALFEDIYVVLESGAISGTTPGVQKRSPDSVFPRSNSRPLLGEHHRATA